MPDTTERTTMPDKYDLAIEYLREHPDEIRDAWSDGYGGSHPACCLFKAASPSGCANRAPHAKGSAACGCLTLVRRGVDDWEMPQTAWTPELAEAIRTDERIPTSDKEITLDHLPVFAEWQRRIDRELGRPQ